jgi:hypothetical protein
MRITGVDRHGKICSKEFPLALVCAETIVFGDDSEYRFVVLWSGDGEFYAQVPMGGKLEVSA